MSAPAELEPVILAIFEHDLQLAVDGAHTDLLDGGLLDSMTFVNLLLAIEQRCGVAIDVQTLDFEQLRTVARIATLVAGLRPLR